MSARIRRGGSRGSWGSMDLRLNIRGRFCFDDLGLGIYKASGRGDGIPLFGIGRDISGIF